MQKIKWILAFVVITWVIASYSYAADIEITDAYACNVARSLSYPCEDDSHNEFWSWDPMVFHIKYTIHGNPSKLYRVVGIIKALGERIVLKEKYYPGDYLMTTTRLVTDEVEPGTYTIKYKVKLKRNGWLVDMAWDTSQITIME